MNDEERFKEFEWQVILLAYEFREVQISDALLTIEAAWSMWRDPETFRDLRRERFRVIEGGSGVI